MSPPLASHVYVTDGGRWRLLRVVSWDGDDVYLTDPMTANAGRVSYHESGLTLLGQPGHDPARLEGRLTPMSEIHGYLQIHHERINTRTLPALLGEPSRFPINGRRRVGSVVMDTRTLPEDLRFLQIDVAARCVEPCHPGTEVPHDRPGLQQAILTNGSHDLVISAWWAPFGSITLVLPGGRRVTVPVAGDLWPLDRSGTAPNQPPTRTGSPSSGRDSSSGTGASAERRT
jgi:hypothetical protein